ncbi:MAG: hypothetical protein ABUT39_24250 [Acidobacteriota bacterium]
MRKPLSFAVVLLSALAAPAWPQIPACEPPLIPEPADPYVFILLDVSGSMNHSAVCSGSLQCFTSMQGDHPDSKWVTTRQALYNVLSEVHDVNLGFATFSNQEALRVRAKHWLYQADTAGPVIPGSGAFPAAGSQEVFGLTWSCTAGAPDGCSVAGPADLNDAWEVTRVRRLPKGGDAFNQTVDIYLRVGASTVYRARYEPVAGGSLGGPVQTNVTTVRCTNSSCSTFIPVGVQTVSWTPVGDFLSWESSTGAASRTQPYSYFNQTAANDPAGQGKCPSPGKWEPNGDDLADTFFQSLSLSYSLKQPTDASDSRGTYFTVGDVIPLDWTNPHRDDILTRLAPNLAVDPLAVPDFRTAAYLEDHPMPGEVFLRLRDELQRPLIPLGQSALGGTMRDFRSWYDGCTGCSGPTGWNDVAMNLDPLWGCRKAYLLILTDSGEECSGSPNPCADVAALNSQAGLKTSVVAVGVPYGNPISCIVQNGKGTAYYASTRQEIEDSLRDFFTNTVGVQP